MPVQASTPPVPPQAVVQPPVDKTSVALLVPPLLTAVAPEALCPVERAMPLGDSLDMLKRYLVQQENLVQEIVKLEHLLGMSKVILEIGCGGGEVAHQIALNNPDMGVIATDRYEWSHPTAGCSHYQQTALAWREQRLAVQQAPVANLVVLRADAEILHHLPAFSIDSILLVNPEPSVGRSFLAFLRESGLDGQIKPGPHQLVIVPYSREMGMMAGGGWEFDHAEDWSRGLGFLMESGFDFIKSERVHWSVDLAGLSPYTKNSTQSDVYCAGVSCRTRLQTPGGHISGVKLQARRP
jgi:hypothetical protein